MESPVLLIDQETVKAMLPMTELLPVIEAAFKAYALKEAEMPAKVYLDLPEYSGDFRAMPAYSKTLKMAGVKWVNSHPKNAEKGFPVVMAMMIINDPETAVPLAIMAATELTNLRTGAAGGVAVNYLARPAAKVLAFIGAGKQALYQLQAILEVRDIVEIRVFDLSEEARRSFRRMAQAFFGGEILLVEGAAAACRDADIIVTTTPSRQAILLKAMISEGTHINAIGADAVGKQELDPEILKVATVIVDDYVQASHSGEINKALTAGLISLAEIKANLGEVIVGQKTGRTREEEITIFDSTGLAIQDIAAASYVYEKAKNRSEIQRFKF